MLFKSRLVPRFLSVWGIVGALMYMLAGYLVLFGVEAMSPILIILSIPLALNEMVLAIWLIVKGFNKEALIEKETLAS